MSKKTVLDGVFWCIAMHAAGKQKECDANETKEI